MGSRTGFVDGRTEAAPPGRSVVREYAEVILVCVLAVIFLRAFVFQQSEIPSGSMEDTLLVGDYIIVNRFLYAPTSFEWERLLLPSREIRHGDVVVFKKPQEPELDFIKRVIGLPGETIQVINRKVHINGKPLNDEEYAYHASSRFVRGLDNHGPMKIPENSYFMMGDNRENSSDSRVWGPVPFELMKGKAFMIYWSWNGPERNVRWSRIGDLLH